MGRPLNSKFFGNAADKLLGSAWIVSTGAAGDVSIVRQRSNLKYEVQAETATSATALTVGVKYIIVAVGTADFTTVGAASNTVGLEFVATGTSAGGAGGTAAERSICKLQATTPTAPGEMTIAVTPENAQAPAEATFTVNRTAGGAIDAVTGFTGGYGYWTGGTFTITTNTDGGFTPGTAAVITYTVANGSIVTAVVTTPGSGYTASADAALAVDTADIPDEAATAPPQFARIINAHQVKCFPAVGGNTFAWPALAPVGGFRGVFSEADIATQ